MLTNTINIIHWNCQGFNAHGPEYLWSLSKSSKLPDIICLQETWYNKQEEHTQIKGYNLASYSVRNTKKKDGGTAIYCRDNIRYTKGNIISKLETSSINIKIDNKTITVVNIYDSATDTKEAEYENIFKQVKNDIIMCGDFNAHHTLWGSNSIQTKGRELYNFIVNNNIVILNDGSGTRLNPINLETSCIDISLVSPNISHKATWAVDHSSTHGSDHFVVSITLNEKPDYKNESVFKWNYAKADWNGFSSKCDQILCEDMVTCNTQETCTLLTDTITNIAGEFIPVRKSNNKSNKPSVPWWNTNCTKAVKDRNKARNKAQHTGNGQDFKNYKEKQNKCRKILNDSQKQYWESYCDSMNSDTKLSKVWYNIKRMLGKVTEKKEIETLIDNNNIYETTKDKADLLAQKFCTVSSTNNYNEEFKKHKAVIENNDTSSVQFYTSQN
ncbi:Hypothetical predicted protein [Mytilus galloprovincialis]|uniref:Endonuclease/exonuclease/phosphatase domain-containing protein n=1 Tax=Mytilus galloprovincialis TaxID=29158 RepID=A0A8B6C7Q6_MYTGA|nr:Hypothetical predicted protein [Mytilus galloprovincialis]